MTIAITTNLNSSNNNNQDIWINIKFDIIFITTTAIIIIINTEWIKK